MVTDQQVRILMQSMRKGRIYSASASEASMDEKTARKYQKLGKLPSEVRADHTWRTREDPFVEVWAEVVPKLSLKAKTLSLDLQRRYYPGRFQDGQLRTFQRIVKQWCSTVGSSRELFFPHVHHLGELCESDFIHMDSLGVTISCRPFSHMIYHFVLTYSNWETGDDLFFREF